MKPELFVSPVALYGAQKDRASIKQSPQLKNLEVFILI
jgi:hypothetical protein